MTGTVKNVFFDRGFSFVTRDDGSGDVFAHCKDFLAGLEFSESLVGQRVEFELGPGRNDRPCAKNVRAVI